MLTTKEDLSAQVKIVSHVTFMLSSKVNQSINKKFSIYKPYKAVHAWLITSKQTVPDLKK